MPRITTAHADHPEVARLVRDLVVEMAARYGDDPDDIKAPDPEARWLLLLEDDGTAIGCGAVQLLSWTVPGAGADLGEIKRVYVVPTARGRGLSRAMMAALLDLAAADEYRQLWLETGTEQPEAIELYRSSGWTRIANYGQYAEDERSVCLALDLDVPEDA